MTKRDRVMQGERVVMSAAELDAWIDDDMPVNVVSLPNPARCGVLDAYIVFTK